MAGDWLPRLPFNKNDLKIFFYASITLLTIVSILALFSYSFMGTVSPLDLIHYNDIRFSFTGTPTYTYMFSNGFNTGLSGINGTETNLTLWEGATLSFFPVGDAGRLPEDDPRLTKEGDRYLFHVGPDEEARVYITVSKSDEYSSNIRFVYKDEHNTTVARSNDTSNITWIVRKSDDEYVLNSYYLPGGNKTFSVIDTVKDWHTDEPYWVFSIRVTVDPREENRQPAARDRLRSYAYNGTIDVHSGGHFWLRAPVKKFSPLYCQNVTFQKAGGDLDVQHNDHKCSSADTIMASREDKNINKTIVLSLLCGHIFAGGDVDSLIFREKNFASPIFVIIKEGNFAILTGLLSSFLTIMLARLVTTIKSK